MRKALSFVHCVAMHYRDCFDFFKSHEPRARAARAFVAYRLINEFPFNQFEVACLLSCEQSVIAKYIAQYDSIRREFPLIHRAISHVSLR